MSLNSFFITLITILGSAGWAFGQLPEKQQPPQEETTGANWLSDLPDDTALQTLHIPGTHNSAALYEPWRGTAKCQSLSIDEQLSAGVRFFDIRCRHRNDRFDLYHGMVNQKQTFGELQQTLTQFLETNPSETLIVSIQETSTSRNNTRAFTETFLDYQKQAPELWSEVSTVPTLGQVRGKMVLLRRFRSPQPIGIPATNWNSNSIHTTKLLLIQDLYKVQKPKTKWQHIEQLWATQPQHPELLALNFTSGYQSGGLPNITAVSNHVPPLLDTKLTTTPPPPSVLILDHVTPELASTIYQLNLAPQAAEPQESEKRSDQSEDRP